MAPPSSRRGRKRKQVAHYTDDNPSTFTKKYKPGVTSVAESTETKKSPSNESKDTTTTRTSPAPPFREAPSRNRKRPMVQQDDNAMIVHDHVMRLNPILPENLLAHDSCNAGHVIFGQGLGPLASLAKPEWQMVSTPHMILSSEETKKKKLPPPRLTCMDISNNEEYMVVGNSLGQVLVYSLVPLVIHVATLETTASRRPQQPLTFKSKKRNEANAIHCISMAFSHLVISSFQEVECYNVTTGTKLWTLTLPSSVSGTKLNIHPTNHSVLASVVYNTNEEEERSSPLWLISSEGDENVQVEKDLLSPSILRCAAMWDCSNSDRMVVVTTPESDEEPQQVLLMNTSFQTLQQATLPPTRTNKSIESISQSPKGMYTCVASSKGIRLYNTETLELVHVYGEGLTLHGHGLSYQQACLFSPSQNEDESFHNGTGVLVIGIPHSRREPRELQDQLQIWQWWDSVHPSLTFAGPQRSLGLAYVAPIKNYLLVLTHAGDVWMLSPTATTDWPGVMYPPGYHVICNNLIYIEDEDELDKVVDEGKAKQEEEEEEEATVLDDELAEALRQSMLEHSTPVKTEENVVVADSERANDNFVIPCHPDPSLKDSVEQNPSVSSPKRRRDGQELPACFIRQVLGVMPTSTRARQQPRVKVLEATTSSDATAKPTRGKRSRAGNLEAMIRASINPELQKFMTSKEQWANGSGSTLRDVDKVPILKATVDADVPTQDTVIVTEKTVTDTGNAAVVTEAAAIEQTQGEVTQLRTTTSLYVNEESRNGEINGEPRLSGEFGRDIQEEATKKALSQAVASRPIDDAATSALEGMLALQRSLSGSEDASPQKSAPASRVPPVPQFGSQSSSTVVEMVVTNSPAASLNAPAHSMTFNQVISASDGGGRESQETIEATGSATASIGVTLETVLSRNSSSEPAASRSRDTDTSAIPLTASLAAAPPVSCSACRGRMVIHTCGKREIPVDVEAIARAEKEKLEREAEEKKRQRAEKRRQADARRREAKRQKKLEEERQRREEEERRRVEEEEMERARKEAEARFSEDHYERDRRRAEMWQRLIAANGGNSQDDGENQQTNEGVQVDTSGGPPLYPSPVQTNDSPDQQRPFVHQSFERSPVDQNMYSEEEERTSTANLHTSSPLVNSFVAGQALLSRSSPIQTANYAVSTEQTNSAEVLQTEYTSVASIQTESIGGRQYHDTQQQQSIGQNVMVSTSTVSQNTGISQSQVDVPTEQTQTQLDQTSLNDEQAPPRPGLLERRSSAQLGTAEALASLANMCFQMPRAPTPQQSPHLTNVTESVIATSLAQPPPTSTEQPAKATEALGSEQTTQNDVSTPNTTVVSLAQFPSSPAEQSQSQVPTNAQSLPTSGESSTSMTPSLGSEHAVSTRTTQINVSTPNATVDSSALTPSVPAAQSQPFAPTTYGETSANQSQPVRSEHNDVSSPKAIVDTFAQPPPLPAEQSQSPVPTNQPQTMALTFQSQLYVQKEENDSNKGADSMAQTPLQALADASVDSSRLQSSALDTQSSAAGSGVSLTQTQYSTYRNPVNGNSDTDSRTDGVSTSTHMLNGQGNYAETNAPPSQDVPAKVTPILATATDDSRSNGDVTILVTNGEAVEASAQGDRPSEQEKTLTVPSVAVDNGDSHMEKEL